MSPPGKVATITAVLADDDPDVRAALLELLDDEDGIDVVAEVATAEEAVAACATHRPDVAVLDVRMPGDGLHAARSITTQGTASRVIILTAVDAPDVRSEARASGASSYIVKSDGVDLVDAIRSADQG